MAAQGLRRAIAGDKAAKLSARRFDGDVGFAGRGRKAFGENFEVVDERFHLRLHFSRWGGMMPAASAWISPWSVIFSIACLMILRLSRISAMRSMYRAKQSESVRVGTLKSNSS